MDRLYKVMLIDDEDMEREGMAAIIPWDQLNMQLVDMAWNGVEGLEKIQLQKPDIVITDIKMPVMDGIELIRRCREIFPDMMFVVLSGYGEFDFTSRAMEQGVRYYVLKPCDEEKIVETLKKVVKDLDQQRQKKTTVQEYRTAVDRMMPHAKDQILSDLLCKKELSPSDQFLLRKITGEQTENMFLLAVRSRRSMDQLDRFTLTNILTELLGGQKIFMNAWTEEEMVYLLQGDVEGMMQPLACKVQREFSRYREEQLSFAVSQRGKLDELWRLYDQIRELFDMDERAAFLSYGSSGMSVEDDNRKLVDYGKIREADQYATLIFEIYNIYLKLQIKGKSPEEIKTYLKRMMKILYGSDETAESELEQEEKIPEFLEKVVELCARKQKVADADNKNEMRKRVLLQQIYEHISDPDMTLQYLAKNVMFMNEDYLGRFILHSTGEKYSAFLVHIRMELAKRLLEYFQDIRIADLATAIGYPPDGQYFTRVFKKYTGMPPSEYKNRR